MANPAVTYTFVNGNVADAGQVNTNFQNIIDGLTDGTKSLNIDALTCAGAFTANGSVDLGNAASDTISMTGYVDTNLTIKSTDAGATAGPDIIIDRDSASAADSDAIGRIIFRGNDDAGTPADNDYASIEATIVDSGAGSEDGKLDFKISEAGTATSYLTIESTKGVANKGRTDGGTYTSGYTGYFKQSSATAVAASASGQYFDVTSISSLPTGLYRIDWQVIMFNNGATAFTEAILGVGTATGNSNQDMAAFVTSFDIYKTAAQLTIHASGSFNAIVTATQIKIYNGTDDAGTLRTGTTLYLKAYANDITSGPPTAYGRITATCIG